MQRSTIAIGSALLGLALLTGSVTALRADPSGQLPGDDVRCYYNGGFCSYDGDAYWSGCDNSYQQGWIPTRVAKVICTDFHPS